MSQRKYYKPGREFMQRMMIQSVVQQWQRIEDFVNMIPDDVDLETDDDALDLCLSIHAITQEWILDERLRAYLSPLDLESNAEDI